MIKKIDKENKRKKLERRKMGAKFCSCTLSFMHGKTLKNYNSKFEKI